MGDGREGKNLLYIHLGTGILTVNLLNGKPTLHITDRASVTNIMNNMRHSTTCTGRNSELGYILGVVGEGSKGSDGKYG